ncbi:MAG: zinc ribbon domain-containing protein [Spirochaetaceae bacterium]|nr:zinc ribbon domain-containing protein [Spirochaetaceae bacterium]
MKRPRYFCESCGAEVRADAKICPHCGSFFSSVKCPRCGHIGESADFRAGCPVCGYALAANPPPDDIKPAPIPADPLPWWVYPLVAAIVLGLILLLLGIIR